MAIRTTKGPPDRTILNKIRRVKSGKPLRVLDIFSGCGGLSLGFHEAGCVLLGAVENDPSAAESHASNFFKTGSGDGLRLHEKVHDITQTEPEDLFRELGYKGSAESLVDIVIGGPPCQAFARVGRAKLRKVHDTEDSLAFLKDPRAALYLRYLYYVERLKPLAVLMENVPDILNFGGDNIAEKTSQALENWGYTCRYTLLNAAFYGVPQMRERMFLLAYRKELSLEVQFPTPTHVISLPSGYHSTRCVATNILRSNGECDHHYTSPPEPDRALTSAVTAKQALSDLPAITEHLNGQASGGRRLLGSPVPYQKRKLSTFAKRMRTWRGFTSNGCVYDHITRRLPRDYPIFRQMKSGDQYPSAHRLALRRFRRTLAASRRRGEVLTPRHKAYKELRASIVPPYDTSKFPNKWWKIEENLPVRTLTAHIGKDTYSHIHYDSAQARTISVREAARLQSFPDGFVFAGSMNDAFRQIGNAVPPLLSVALAREIKKKLRAAARRVSL